MAGTLWGKELNKTIMKQLQACRSTVMKMKINLYKNEKNEKT